MKTVLVVDDESRITQLARDYLEHAGLNVFTARDGKSALATFRAEKPDLIVLDLGLPGMDGLDVTRAVRKDSNAPIIMLTARGEESDKLVGLELGADDYIVKPFNPQELAARVQAVLRRTRMPPPSKSSVIRFAGGTLIIDPKSPTVIRDGKPIELTPTEHRILLFLAEHPGRVVSVEDIFTAVWGFETEVNLNNVKWYVWRLRQKLEGDADQARFIFTERGAGYRFTAV